MRIALFIPCFVDHYYPRAAISIVKVLERLGHQVEYPPGQTCCGQPAFNSGYWDEARTVAARLFDIFRDAEVVVSASGSCGAMLKVFNPEMFKDSPHQQDAAELAAKTFEFSDFLVHRLGVEDVGASFPHKVTFHDGCHGLRELRIHSQPRRLLANVRGLDLVEMEDNDTCCGFGGTFAVKFPHISRSMGGDKCRAVRATGSEFVVSNDASCLMQIEGMLRRDGSPVRGLHLAEVLASQ